MDRPCTVLIQLDKSSESKNATELQAMLEEGTLEQKIRALKQVILLLNNGEHMPQMLMTVIRFCMPLRNHTIKKLLLIYWEVADKYGQDGKLLHEMILVCNMLRNDLNSPNEYVRGATLRFLCKMRDPEVLEPLVPSVKTNLEHRHSYVRRNAVLAVFSIYRLSDALMPDAPDLITEFLASESDTSCRRNAFIMLFNCAQERAIEYLSTCLDEVPTWGDILQLSVVELIRKLCRSAPSERSKYMRCIFSLLESPSPAVRYESAQSLLSLSTAPTAVRAVSNTYIDLLINESDNNVKMIVLDRLLEVKARHEKIVGEMLMDLLRVLSSPNMDIRRKTLDICLDLLTPRNIEDVVQYLKKEISKTQSSSGDKESGDYRQMLVQAIHQCAVKFPEVAGSVVHMIMDFLGDSKSDAAADVISFVREVIQTYPPLQHSIVTTLFEAFALIKLSRVYRPALWIVGEYCTTQEDIEMGFSTLEEAIGELPLVKDPSEEDADAAEAEAKKQSPQKSGGATGRVAVLADGTYATQTSLEQKTQLASSSSDSSLRSLLFAGDFFLGSCLVNTLTKLALRYRKSGATQEEQSKAEAKVLLVASSILRLGTSELVSPQIDQDSQNRILASIQVLYEADEAVTNIWLNDCRQSLVDMLATRREHTDAHKKKSQGHRVQVDDLISFRHLRPRRGGPEDDVDVDVDLVKATGNAEVGDYASRLNRIFQLTGFSDPVYAEAYVNVHQYDIVMDILVVNQTPDTLQNLCIELATLGDLKLCERPQNYTIGPLDQRHIKANIKVTSTETGLIFGNIVYDIAGTASNIDRNCVILNEIHIDIMDYISPASCADLEFRKMWAQFEWENKVSVNTSITDLKEYLQHIMKCTNMACMTSDLALDGDCDFLAANLYARSVFGEDALANVSIEKKRPNGKVVGFIRIRSKSQGIALSLGDKITLKQKGGD